MLVAENGEQRGGLQRGIAFKLAGDPRPVCRKRVRPRAVAAGLRELTGQATTSLIGAGRAHAHPSTRRGLLLGSTFGSFSQHAEDLRVPFHGVLLFEEHHPGPLPRSSAQSATLVGHLTWWWPFRSSWGRPSLGRRAMTRRRKDPLRALTDVERTGLEQL